jgi:cytochrome P450
MEVLRLHPPVHTDMKYAVNNDIYPMAPLYQRELLLCILHLQWEGVKKILGEDAEKFKPDRFYKQQEPSAFKFVAFNAGPRTCLGKPLVLMNMKMTLAILL